MKKNYSRIVAQMIKCVEALHKMEVQAKGKIGLEASLSILKVYTSILINKTNVNLIVHHLAIGDFEYAFEVLGMEYGYEFENVKRIAKKQSEHIGNKMKFLQVLYDLQFKLKQAENEKKQQ